jgi:hypothetical protein
MLLVLLEQLLSDTKILSKVMVAQNTKERTKEAKFIRLKKETSLWFVLLESRISLEKKYQQLLFNVTKPVSESE